MRSVGEFQDRVKFYESHRGLSFRDSMEAALNEFVSDERERCAAYVERNKIVQPGSDTLGPLFDIGWNTCCKETAKGLRAT